MPKNLITRIQNKHDIEANWKLATNFTPLAGEIIIYDPDSTHAAPRVKIGDGSTLVNNLKFIDVDFDTHEANSNIHITADEKASITTAKTHATSAHAPANAEKNQNAFSNIVVGSTTIAADITTDSLTLVAGSNITITPDATNDKITIAASGVTVDTALSSTSTNPVQNKVIYTALSGKSDTDHTHKYAGAATAGGSATSAVKLDSSAGTATQPVYFSEGKPVATTHTLGASVPSDAKFTDTIYTHPSYTAKTSGLYKVTVDATGHVSSTAAVAKSDITALGIPAQDTTYSTGTASVAGITKLYTGTGSGTDGTMTQNAITTALSGKETSGAAASALTSAKSYTDTKVGELISCGTADPSTSTNGQFYFKYTT